MDNRNINPEENKNLKRADFEKFGKEPLSSKRADSDELLRREKRAKDRQIRGEEAVEIKKSKKIPLGVDIALAILIVILAAALVVGMYFVIRRHSIGYTSADVEYTVLLEGVEEIDVNGLKDKQVYYDTDDNAVYMGKITEAKVLTDENGDVQVIANISVNTRYRKGKGYLVDENPIAMGCKYALRIEETVFDTTVVEMSKGDKK